ncbi:MAG TPA: choice-of-anchor tandem repeat NxxGxxAF-containing protein, partial [Candidatus Polarisedimenticolia bacterium]|nr:choice-of-anchor tandem repeat NxxGxxAF-containing protein [Candidatus Polarisedimenticolia bacterium]
MLRNSASRIPVLLLALTTALAGSVAAPATGFAATYTFTKIADTNVDFIEINAWPAINNAGTVAFLGFRRPSFTPEGIYGGNGGAVTTFVDDSGAFSGVFGSFTTFGDVQINDSGTVSTLSVINNFTGSGIFSANGVSATPISTSGLPCCTSYGAPTSINSSGTVAFNGVVGGVLGIYTGNGGPLTTVADTT